MHGFRRQQAHQIVVRAAAHGGIQIDHLNLAGRRRSVRSISSRRVRLRAPSRGPAQLHHFAVHQVDTRKDHSVVLTGMPCRSRSSFNCVDCVGAVVKDRCRQRRVGFAFGQHAHEMSGLPAPPRGDHRNMRGTRDGRGQRAIEAFLHAVGIHRSQQDLARAQFFAARRPRDGVDAFVVAAAARVDVPLRRRRAAARRWPAPRPARRIRGSVR